jgi:hypothetical protein
MNGISVLTENLTWRGARFMAISSVLMFFDKVSNRLVSGHHNIVVWSACFFRMLEEVNRFCQGMRRRPRRWLSLRLGKRKGLQDIKLVEVGFGGLDICHSTYTGKGQFEIGSQFSAAIFHTNFI